MKLIPQSPELITNEKIFVPTIDPNKIKLKSNLKLNESAANLLSKEQTNVSQD